MNMKSIESPVDGVVIIVAAEKYSKQTLTFQSDSTLQTTILNTSTQSG